MKKRFKNIIIILVSVLVVEIIPAKDISIKAYGTDKPAAAFNDKDSKFRVNARCAIALDKECIDILYEQNAYELVPMASTTKILTSLIAIEEGDLDRGVKISK